MNGIGRFAKNIFQSIADVGENFLDFGKVRGTPVQKLNNLCKDLVSQKGAASGMALARAVVFHYQNLNEKDRLNFFTILLNEYGSDSLLIKEAAEEYISNPSEKSIDKIRTGVATKRLELFNRMNMAPNGTTAIVDMRRDLLRFLKNAPDLKPVDNDLKSLMISWFNPGFLELRRIDWDTEASILEKIIQYETVHNIENWNDLKQRLVENRRCFAFFHPALEDEPLIFVEVALTKGIAGSMETIFKQVTTNKVKYDTAIFYSINNCQRGLRGIPLGNFLIKRVVAEIALEIPSIKKFSSLSPVTGFAKWFMKQTGLKEANLPEIDKMTLMLLNKKDWHKDKRAIDKLQDQLLEACAHYLVKEKERGRPINPVARFHFGNGAELYRINWMANTSAHGLEDSFGIMVNYRYDPKHIESNHEDYVRDGELAISKSVKALLN